MSKKKQGKGYYKRKLVVNIKIYTESGAERDGAEDLGTESNSQMFTDESRRLNEAIETKIGT